MNLIKCPKCGNEVNENVAICPKCNFIINDTLNPKTSSIIYLIQSLVFLLISIVVLYFGFSTSSEGKIVCILLGIFFFVCTCISFAIYIKELYKYRLSKTDYTAYQEYIENERNKNIETQDFLRKQNEEKLAKKYNNYKYKCPMCNSNKIVNISTARKVVSTEMLGLASNKIGKTYQCDECKYMW